MASRVIRWDPGKYVAIVMSSSGKNLVVAIGGTIVAGVLGFVLGSGTAFAESSPGAFMGLLVGGAVAVGVVLMWVAGALSSKKLTLDWADRTARLRSRAGGRTWPFADIKAVIVEKELINVQQDVLHTTNTVVRVVLSVADQRFLLDDGVEDDGLSKRARDLAAALSVPLQ